MINIIHDLPPKQSKSARVGVDIEIFNAEKPKLHLPITGDFALLQIALENGDVHVITNVKDVAPALKRINNAMWCMMKGQFDIAHLRRWANVPDREMYWDIMYIDKIMWGGYFENHAFSLAALARRYLNIHLDKSVRDQFHTATELSDEMIQYGAEDAWYTLQISKKQKIRKDWYENIWQDIDLPAMWAFLASKPFRIDKDAWAELAQKNDEIRNRIKEELGFNTGSWQQIKKFFKENGYEVENTQEETLIRWVKDNPDTPITEQVKMILEAKQADTYANKYGMKFIEKFIYEENDYYVVKPDYYVVGAETGRTAAADPPIHGIPSRKTLVYRGCFLARPGNKLVIGDYSSQEPRTAAYRSGDKEFIKIVNSGEDIYLKAGSNIYDDEEENKRNRKKTKDAVLGPFYGQTPYGLSKKWNVAVGVAEDYIDKLFRPFPKLRRYFDNLARRTNYVETVAGRRIWLNEYSYQCENNARNGPHQGTAADMIKLATANMYRDWDDQWGEWALIEMVHDEVGFDVPEEYAEEVARFTEYKMIETAETMCPGVKFEVDVKICDTWAEAKAD